MKKLRYFFIILLFPAIMYANFYESQILEYGGDVSALGSGGVVAGRNFIPGVTMTSPASAADVEFSVLSFNYGDILGFNNFLQISYLYPTSRGVLAGNVRYFGANLQNIGLDNGFHFNLNFSKVFTDKLFVGIGLNFLKADYSNDSGITFGLNLGGIYHFFPYNTKMRKDKTVKNFRIGLSLLNMGTALSQNDEVISPPFTIRTGPSIDLGILKKVVTTFSADLIFRKISEVNIGLGLENVINDKVAVRIGYQITSDFADISAGLGYRFKVGKIEPEINYALISSKNSKLLHFLGANIRFGSVDKTPPEINIKLDKEDISPNYDGHSDYLEITPTIEDDKTLKYWDAKIVDENNNIVREYKSPNIDTLEGKITVKKVFTRLFEKKKEAPVPDKIVWDGLDKDGKQAKDGKYKILVTAYDENKNESQSKPVDFVVDNTPPTIDISIESLIFSPNGDGVKDTIEFKLNVQAEPTDEWTAEIKNKDGDVIKIYKWRGNKIEDGHIIWNGKDNDGNMAEDGNYELVITGKDKAGNSVVKKVVGITLTTAKQSVAVSADLPAFSPNNDGVMDKVLFETYISDTKGLEKWALDITDEDNNVVKSFSGDKHKQVPEKIEWNGRDNKNMVIKDGTYFYKFGAWYDSGNHPESFPKKIIIDNSNPETKLEIFPIVFSPDGDNEDDVLNLSISVEDKSKIKNWDMTITEVSNDKKVFKQFKGDGMPANKILWDGRSDNGDLVQAKNKYYVALNVEDELGNKSILKDKEIIISTEPPDVGFKFETDVFSPDGDGNDDVLKTKLFSYDGKKIKKWNLEIYKVTKEKKRSLFKTFNGTNLPPKDIVWDGNGDNGDLIQSADRYYTSLSVEDVLGNKNRVPEEEIKINREPPNVNFDFSPKLFSPDEDGIADVLKIDIVNYDKKKLKHWSLNIYPLRDGKRESLFKNFEGAALTKTNIKWDGKSDKGELVESAMDYEMELVAEDILGNVQKVKKILKVDILVIKTPYGWKIKISNIEFEYNKAELKGNAFDILDRVIEILNKYKNYQVRVEGHTDNIGSLNYNLDLSKRRAESVKDYLIDNGVSVGRLSTIGLAFKYPVASNDTDEGRAKNRRVEFILIKPGASAPERK